MRSATGVPDTWFWRSTTLAERLRILSVPGRYTSTQYVPLFCRSLEEVDLRVVDVDSRDSLLFRFDILHLHFPHHYVVEQTYLLAIIFYVTSFVLFSIIRVLGKHVVYTVHDVAPFYSRHSWILSRFLNMVHRSTDGFVFLSPSSQAEFYRRNPTQAGKPFLMLGHASFPVPRPSPEARLRRRSAIVRNPQAFLLGYIGFRRPRKGLENLSILPGHLSNGRPVELFVAGGVQPDFVEESSVILGRLPPNVLTLRDASLSDDELNGMLQAVDIVLLPYTIGWNSGMAMLVLSNRARLIGSDLPMFLDLQAAVGAPWVYTYSRSGDSNNCLAAAIERAASDDITEDDCRRLEDFLAVNSFAAGAARVREFYQRLTGHAKSNVWKVA